MAVVDDVTTENDDGHRTGDAPVRAAFCSEPFVEPFAQRVLAKNRAARHVRPSYSSVIEENVIERGPFPRRQSRRLTSLIFGE
jgi:hypothetical protein